jgi:hypothetical protein
MSGVLRVMVHQAWDEVVLPWQGDASLADVKAAALEITRVAGDAGEFVFKFNGAELRDETATVAACGVPENGALILLLRRRRPVH